MLKAKLLKLNPLIEEEVLLEINGVELVGFSTICPYQILPNKTYQVRLYFICLDGIEIRELDQEIYDVLRVNETYEYVFKGRVINGGLDIGHDIKIKDDYFKENNFLDNKFVSIKIDRLGVEFL